jgi:hypothetical protein
VRIQRDAYFLLTFDDLLQEVDIGGLHIGEESRTVLEEELIELLLTLDLLLNMMNVDSLLHLSLNIQITNNNWASNN